MPADLGVTVDLAGYVVERTLATTAFCTLSWARQTATGRAVVLKTLRAAVEPTGPYREVLQREATALARLCSPCIVLSLEDGSARPTPFLALEALDGVPLDRLLATRRRPSLGAAVAVGAAVARALEYAHARGVTHRDTKPGNVVLTRDGQCKLIDFGLARVADVPAFAGDAPALLRIGTAGTATAYAAPEALRGEAAGPASDLFGLGAMLFELLTGERATSSSLSGDGRAALSHSALGQRGALLRAPSRIVPAIPKELDTLVLQLLAPSPQSRPSATEVRRELEAAYAMLTPEAAEVSLRRALGDAGLPADPVPALEPARRSGLRGGFLRDAGPNRGTTGQGTMGRRRANVWGAGGPWAVARTAGWIGCGAVIGALAYGATSHRGAVSRAAASAPPNPARSGETLGAATPTDNADGELYVTATPWADVFVDGVHKETTPFAAPILLSAGSHRVVLKHPAAPVVERSVDVVSGEATRLHVELSVRGWPPQREGDDGDGGSSEGGS